MDSDPTALVKAFEACTLPHAEWTHTAHLTVALYYLRRFSRDDATVRIRDGIQRYNASNGNHKGYHETVTLAWIAVISRFLSAEDNACSDRELVDRLLKSCGQKDYLLRYYSRARLFSDAARKQWLSPDLSEL
jgi:hypothetical protein